VKRSLIRRALRDRFVVTLITGEAFDGVLLEADDRHYVLADAAQITAAGDRVQVDGKLWLQHGDVAYLQQPGT
jgi:hypothetical protein